MIKRLLVTVVVICCAGLNQVQAQQVPFYNHALINPFIYNPAWTGNSDYTNLSFVRNQRFSSFGSTAVGNYLTAEGPVMNGKMGLGLTVSSQSQGIQQQLMSSLNYSYKLTINESSYLRFGVSGGVMDNRIDDENINAQESDDPYFTGLRATAPVFDMNVGLLYSVKGLRVGFSVPQITGGKVKYADETSRGYYQLARHFMGSAEYDFKLGDKFILRPNAMVRYIPSAPFQYDGTVMAMYDNKIWASATYKSDYAIQFNAGVRVWDFLRVGYSYELLVGSLKTYNTGTNHEIFVGFSFKGKTEKVIERVEIEKEVIRLDERAARERDSLQVIKDSLEDQLKRILEDRARAEQLKKEQDSLANVPKPRPANEDVKIEVAKGYRFKELDGTTSPDGYYVITGVYSSNDNAQRALERNKQNYPSAYLVVNEVNTWQYVVALYSTNQAAALDAFYDLKSKQKAKVWILNYRKP